MSDSWRVEIATARGDRTVLTSTEIESPSFERYIGKVGTFSATMAAPSAAAAARLAPLLRDDAALTFTAYVSRGSEIWWGGRLGDPEAVLDARAGDAVKISGSSFEAYPDDRTIYDDITWSQIDQVTIATDLWNSIQEDEGDLGITIPTFAPTGQLRDETVARGDKKTVGSVLSEISNRIGGFEWIINCYRDGTARKRELVIGYPIIGGEAGPSYTYPGQLQSVSRKVSTAKTGTRFWSIGGAVQDVSGDGTNPPIYTAQQRVEGLLSNGAILIDRPNAYSDVSEQATLDQKTVDAAATYGQPLPIVAAEILVADATPALLGLKPRLRINHPFYPSPAPGVPGYDASPRVIGLQVKPDERGVSGTVQLTFEETD